jgi:hypothetical protein
VQAAGGLNLVRNDAGACQLAGVGNITEGSFQGLQSAGVINTAKTINGVQVSGVLNIIDGDAEKCQIAGVGNFTDGNFQGLQTAGVISVAKTVKGSQISGVLNATEKATGAQIAGVANIVPEIKGTQIAGVINVSDKIEGLQLSGCVNRTSFIKGTQISVVNFSDSCVGIPIGVFSYVGNGYRTLELSVDELLFANLAFKSGVNQFYNIFMAGIRPGNFENPIWTFGYGIGTRFGTQNNVHFDLELSAQHISKGHVRNYLSELCRVYFGVEKKISSWSSVSFGLSYNMYLVDTDSPYSETLSSIAPYHFFNSTSPKGYNIKTWLGGRVAFRF